MDSSTDRGSGLRRFSVIVPVFNRTASLRRLLSSLGAQSYPRDRFEVLVCDDGSTEDLAPVVEDARATTDLLVVYLRQSNQGPAAAMNLGLEHANGEIVAFTDSDAVTASDWLAAFDRAFEDPGVEFVGGVVSYRSARYLSGRCMGFLMASTLGGGGATDPSGWVHMDYYPSSCNMAVRRELALAVGGFPRVFRNQDTEFGFLLALRGVRPRFIPGAGVLHDEQNTLGEVFRENYLKGACAVRHAAPFRLSQLIPALPALLIVNIAVLVVTAVFQPSAAGFVALPLAAYLMVLLVLAAQGYREFGELTMACAIPAYALVMHLAYGAGYLARRLWPRVREGSVVSTWTSGRVQA